MKQKTIEVLMVEPGREPRIVKNQLVSDKCESFLLKITDGEYNASIVDRISRIREN